MAVAEGLGSLEARAQGRRCGECSLCCTLLRVDELRKLGGVPCSALGPAGRGCSIHATRPAICRAYRCLWLQGGLEEADRPDRLGAVLDLVTEGMSTRLTIREAEAGAFERSPRLQQIAASFRESLPVRINDVEEVLDPDRPYRVLLPGGEEQRVRGERVEILREGRLVAERRLPWAERWLRRLGLALQRRRLTRWPRPPAPPTA